MIANDESEAGNRSRTGLKKKTNNDLQKITQKTKDWATPLITWGELM